MTLPAGSEQTGAVNGAPVPGTNPPAQGAQSAQTGTPLTVEAMMAAMQPVLAGIVKDTVSRQMRSLLETTGQPAAAAGTTGEGAATTTTDTPKPGRKGSAGEADEVAALRTRVDRAEAERAAERARADEQARATEVRNAIGKHGVVDIEQVFRIVSPDLRPGKDGKLYATSATGEFLTPEEHIANVLRTSPHLLRGSGAGGSGGAGGDRQSGQSSGTEISYGEYVEKLKALDGDTGATAAFVQRIGRGEIRIKKA